MIRFVAYGVFGWSAEIVWSALYVVVAAWRAGEAIDRRLMGKTYLWMFPIYGAGGLLFERVHAEIAFLPMLVRGVVYMLGCFVIEYATGMLLKKTTGRIPWDYSYARFHIHGAIRLDYIPVWFVFGLLLEKVEAIVGRL